MSKLTTTTTNFDEEVESAGLNLEAFRVYLANEHNVIDENWQDHEDAFTEAYVGLFESTRAFTEHIVDESCMFQGVPDNITRYFDYESYWRDLFAGGEYWETDNYYFRSY
jgi:antirestriction protein